MSKPRELRPTLPEMNAVDDEASGTQRIADAWDDVYIEMRNAFKARDYGRAVDLGERFLQRSPTHAASQLFVQECRTLLEHQLARRLGSLDRVVTLRAPLQTLMGATLDARAAFLLSRIDGRASIEDLLDLVPMPRADALRILVTALDDGLVAIA